MDIGFLTQAAQLGGTVFTVVSFLWFLNKLLGDLNERQTVRDEQAITASNRQSDTNVKLAVALEALTNKVTDNSGASSKNTLAIKENVSAVEDNTKAVNKSDK